VAKKWKKKKNFHNLLKWKSTNPDVDFLSHDGKGLATLAPNFLGSRAAKLLALHAQKTILFSHSKNVDDKVCFTQKKRHTAEVQDSKKFHHHYMDLLVAAASCCCCRC